MKSYADRRYFDNIKEAQRGAGKYDSALKKCLDTLIMNDAGTKIFKEADAKFSYNIRKMMDDALHENIIKLYCRAYFAVLHLFKKKVDVKKSKSPCLDLTFLSLKNIN